MSSNVYLSEEYRKFLHLEMKTDASASTYFSRLKHIASRFEEVLQVQLFVLIEQTCLLDPSRNLLRTSLFPVLIVSLDQLYEGRYLNDARSYLRKYFLFLSEPTPQVALQEQSEEGTSTISPSQQELGQRHRCDNLYLTNRMKHRLTTQDRAYEELYIPIRLLKSLNADAIEEWCEECIDNTIVFVKEGSITCREISSLFFTPEEQVFALTNDGELHKIFTPLASDGKQAEMKASDFSSISIDHTKSISSVAREAVQQGEVPALSTLTKILRGLGANTPSDLSAYASLRDGVLKHPSYSEELIAQAVDELGLLTKRCGLRLMSAGENKMKH
ncbi:MAG: hypothetical protein SPK09_02195 [Porphyromonas sp.]|nr:hypothetical protein [Porphyromonas sp.]